MMFGGATDEAQARRIIDQAAENGVNFIDTADVYADGRSEAIVGPAIKARRDHWVLATKGAQQMGAGRHRQGTFAPLSDAGRRCQPEAAADRAHRSLLHPPHRSLHALGADDCHVRRPDPPGQDPRMGAVQRARLAHPACGAPMPADGRAAARSPAALLQPDEPSARDRTAAGCENSSIWASCPTARWRAACSRASTRSTRWPSPARAPPARTCACWKRSGAPKA